MLTSLFTKSNTGIYFLCMQDNTSYTCRTKLCEYQEKFEEDPCSFLKMVEKSGYFVLNAGIFPTNAGSVDNYTSHMQDKIYALLKITNTLSKKYHSVYIQISYRGTVMLEISYT